MNQFLFLMAVVWLLLSGQPAHAEESRSAMLSRASGLTVEGCPRLTLEEVARGFFENPRWEEKTSSDGRGWITVWGQMRHPNPEGVYARLWYALQPGEHLAYHHLDFSGLHQQDWIYRKRLQVICEASP